MIRSIEEINQKIREGRVVVYTAEEIIDVVREKGVSAAAREVDVVTTGTFSPMCSSGAYFNIKQPKIKIKMGGGTAYLDRVPAYAGFAAADIYLGATALPDQAPRNARHPGEFPFGGAHVIEALVSGKKVTLTASAYGTDCYPALERDEEIGFEDMNEAVLFNPRNCYQNYNVAVNLSDKTIYTYMGVLRPNLGNANYCSAGQLSPLLNDPLYRTIGIGTRIFLGGGKGYVVWPGTQHNPNVPRTETGAPKKPSGTLAVMGDLKKMSPAWLRALSFVGYGVTLSVGIGIPIPILDEEVMKHVSVTDAELWAPVVDYSRDYPYGEGGGPLAEVTYAQLKSGRIELMGKQVPTGAFSSILKAREIAGILKDWIRKGNFELTSKVASLPGVKGGEAL
ncbi:MAG: homocysteine biosynthesis protein [Deltaproteobacteria bacterium]|nr:homocysteine biosynthesis protein [Deltaproteobacteria bacterium]